MIENPQNVNRVFLIKENPFIDEAISVIKSLKFLSTGGPSIEDCEKLKKISSGKCSKETKETIITFMKKFGKLYKKDFPDLLEDLWEFESNANANRKRRDHVCHSFHVWCLGLWLYRNGFSRYINAVTNSENKFYFVWYLTAFYHDVGYINRHDLHGGDSAQILLSRLNKIFSGKWTPDAIHAFVAICLHDKNNYQVDLVKDPYSALLIICDEIQEWGRYIPKHERIYEINKLKFQNNFNDQSPKLDIKLYYQMTSLADTTDFNKYVDKKQKSFDEKFQKNKRLTQINVHVECQKCS